MAKVVASCVNSSAVMNSPRGTFSGTNGHACGCLVDNARRPQPTIYNPAVPISPVTIVKTTDLHVPETHFGRWFLNTTIWAQYVLEPAIKELERLIPERRDSYPIIVDIGCGSGRSFKMLFDRFAPQRLIGVDIDPGMIAVATSRAAKDGVSVEFMCGSSSRLALPDGYADIVFCHQTFHHLVDQENALREFHRVLKPGGMLFFAESTRRYIHSWIIKLLFRHPMDVQRTAQEYLAMVRNAGFQVADTQVSYPYFWWSRDDIGIKQYCLRIPPAPQGKREETVISLVGVRAEAN